MNNKIYPALVVGLVLALVLSLEVLMVRILKPNVIKEDITKQQVVDICGDVIKQSILADYNGQKVPLWILADLDLYNALTTTTKR